MLLSEFNETWIFLTHFQKILESQTLMKIRPVGAEFSHAFGQTDMTKLLVAFRNFAKAPQNYRILLFLTWVKPAFMMGMEGGNGHTWCHELNVVT